MSWSLVWNLDADLDDLKNSVGIVVDVLKAWIKVWAAEEETEGDKLCFFRWKKTVLLI